MNLTCKILLYLDKTQLIKAMEESCKIFLENYNEKSASKFPPFRFVVELDVMDLLDVYPDVGEVLLKEPCKWHRHCCEILFSCMQSINEHRFPIKKSQVLALIRLKSVPQFVSRPNPRNYSGLVIFTGLLIETSKPGSYVYHSVWSCPEECEDSEVISQCIPKGPPKCYVCRSVLYENSGLRRCGEQVAATFKLGSTVAPKSMRLTDDLITKLQLGSLYNIHAIVVKKTLQVWSIEEVLPLAAPATSPIPNDIEELYLACKGIPWQFIYCMASSIAVVEGPLNCFVHLKINLLLSLASVKANQLCGSSIIHVLAGGLDSGYVIRLMQEAVQLADRHTVLGTTNSSVSTALTGSSGGVCIMPLPLQNYNQKQISGILSSIESGEIIADANKAKLRGAVWAHGMDFKKISLLNIASVFGTLCRGDCGDYDDELSNFVLENAIKSTSLSKDEFEALKDIREYIAIVAGLKVTLDKESEALLRSYFLAARKERPRAVSIGGMGALVAMCLTAARLCRRSTTNIEDAVLAIWLHTSGGPEPRFAPEEYLVTPDNIDSLRKVMQQFKDWLEQFTGYII